MKREYVKDKITKGRFIKRKEETDETDRNNIPFWLDQRGMGTVEIILIIVVLIGLVLIFKTQIQELVSIIFQKISADSSAILS